MSSSQILRNDVPTAHNFRDVTGLTFGTLQPIAFAGRKNDTSFWYCKCACGNHITASVGNLHNKRVTNCGCVHKKKYGDLSTRHPSPELAAYIAMKNRCGPNVTGRYRKHYVLRGISVCERWLEGVGSLNGFHCFLKDVGPKPTEMHSLDRINNDGNYEPGNVRWATKAEQARNRTSTRMVSYKGETMPLIAAIELSGIRKAVVHGRLRRGWSIDEALAV